MTKRKSSPARAGQSLGWDAASAGAGRLTGTGDEVRTTGAEASSASGGWSGTERTTRASFARGRALVAARFFFRTGSAATGVRSVDVDVEVDVSLEGAGGGGVDVGAGAGTGAGSGVGVCAYADPAMPSVIASVIDAATVLTPDPFPNERCAGRQRRRSLHQAQDQNIHLSSAQPWSRVKTNTVLLDVALEIRWNRWASAKVPYGETLGHLAHDWR